MKFKITVYSVLVFIGLIVLSFGLELGGLQWAMFFNPRWQNVERKTFESTKSYNHGKIQDLANYYEQYNRAESTADKQVISNVIKASFATFDASTINSFPLRQFLISTRGF